MSAYVEQQKAEYRRRAHGKLYRADRPTASGAEYVGTLTLPDGKVWILEAKVVTETIDGKERRHFAITPFNALLRGARIEPGSDVSAIPGDLVSLMEAPFDDPIPPEPSSTGNSATP